MFSLLAVAAFGTTLGMVELPQSGGKRCDAAPAQELIGKPWIPPLENKIRKLTTSNSFTLMRPQTRPVKDRPRPDRVTVHLDLGDKIAHISCG